MDKKDIKLLTYKPFEIIKDSSKDIKDKNISEIIIAWINIAITLNEYFKQLT